MNACGIDFEDKRLAALYDYDVLDTQPEDSFDRITRLVKITVGTPVAVVSLVDRNRQWFKSRQGIDTVETPRDISFCTHTILKDEPLIVPNALEDSRFRDSPLVTCENGVRFYAGVPLKTPGGYNIGALCAIDTKPGKILPAQISVMQDLAWLVVDELELRKLATTDSLTGALTGRAFGLETWKEAVRAKRYDRNLGCVMLDIDHFKIINDTYGHPAGDLVLSGIAGICSQVLRETDLFGRVGGEEFCLALTETSLSGAFEAAERLRQTIASTPFYVMGKRINVTASFGVAMFRADDTSFEVTRARSDSALYLAKDGGRNRVCTDSQSMPAGHAYIPDQPHPSGIRAA